MESCELTLAGLGAAVIIARSSLVGGLFRRPANVCWKALAGSLGSTVEPNEEWCLYCVGFWVGLVFGNAGRGWLDHPLYDGLYLAGVCWIAAELSAFFESFWFAFMERDDGLQSQGSGKDLGERQGKS